MTTPREQSRKGTIAVFGASGHTARFVLRELRERGFRTRAIVRDAARLDSLEADERVQADLSNLVGALTGCALVINCAGPFGETAPAVLQMARTLGIHAIDITAESLVAIETFERFSNQFPASGPLVAAPAFGFFGALGDLLATALVGDWPDTDHITLAVALDSWVPTRGTRLAGAKRAGRRVVFHGGKLEVLDPSTPPPAVEWTFAAPFGHQRAIGELSNVDVVTISRHVRCQQIDALINESPLADFRSERTGPEVADADGRSAQRFLVEVVVERDGETRRGSASGQDIYAVTAPLVAEAAERILSGRTLRRGLGTAGELFDARDFLAALSPKHLRIELPST